jgi:hypothetical protein
VNELVVLAIIIFQFSPFIKVVGCHWLLRNIFHYRIHELFLDFLWTNKHINFQIYFSCSYWPRFIPKKYPNFIIQGNLAAPFNHKSIFNDKGLTEIQLFKSLKNFFTNYSVDHATSVRPVVEVQKYQSQSNPGKHYKKGRNSGIIKGMTDKNNIELDDEAFARMLQDQLTAEYEEQQKKNKAKVHTSEKQLEVN